MGGLDGLQSNINIGRGQVSVSSQATQGNRIIYLARVVDNIDFANMGRIKAEIIDFDETTGEERGGKDRFDNTSKYAYPLIPQFVNIMPRIDELVYVILENPKDQSSRRFYLGPIRSVRYGQSTFESTASANDMFNNSNFNGRGLTKVVNDTITRINDDNIYIKGKDDADVILKPKEVMIRAGSLVNNTFQENKTTACKIQLKQFDAVIENDEVVKPAYSQTNIIGSNINLISSDSSSAQNRSLNESGNLSDSSNVEKTTNPNLEVYGEQAKKLHPLVLGDELVKVLKLLIRFCLNHRHTPQEIPYGPEQEIEDLNELLADETIQKILSKSVRTN
jgi:hypothetical protein